MYTYSYICISYISYIVQPSTDDYVLLRITQQYYLLKRFVNVLGQILLNEMSSGMNLEHNFAGQMLDIYQLSYTSAITIRKIVSYLFTFFLVACNAPVDILNVSYYYDLLNSIGTIGVHVPIEKKYYYV